MGRTTALHDHVAVWFRHVTSGASSSTCSWAVSKGNLTALHDEDVRVPRAPHDFQEQIPTLPEVLPNTANKKESFGITKK